MSLLDNLFSFAELTQVFDDRALLQAMLDFEAALARAEASLGVIPKSAAGPITVCCRAELFDLQAIATGAGTAGNLAIPLIKELTAKVNALAPEAARFVHWGATSQDVIDTALVLQFDQARALVELDLTRLSESLAKLADEHRNTPIAARTWLQQAVPATLGLKFAGWLDALNRHRARFAECQGRVLVLQFGGAAGTLASLADQGLKVATALAAELKLPLPDMPWHTARDRIAEAAVCFGLLAGTLGKMARDISLMAQSEVGELSEPSSPGRGGSSAMPNKRNPVASAVALAAATRVPGLVSTVLSAMVQEHERALGGWQAEWETLPQIVRLTGGALHHMADLVAGLEIHRHRMLANLGQTQGLIFAESVSIALAQHLGKSAAHELVEKASRRAIEEGKHLRAVLLGDELVRRYLTNDQIDKLFDPLAYLGMASEFISRTINSSEGKNSEGESSEG